MENRTLLREVVRYYDERRWRSSRGKLVVKGDELTYEGFGEMTIPLMDLVQISLKTNRQLLCSGLNLADLEYKPASMLFLRLDHLAPSDVVDSKIIVATVFGSCYNNANQANRQMRKIKRTIYQARANLLYEQRMLAGRLTPQSEELPVVRRKRSIWSWLSGLLG